MTALHRIVLAGLTATAVAGLFGLSELLIMGPARALDERRADLEQEIQQVDVRIASAHRNLRDRERRLAGSATIESYLLRGVAPNVASNTYLESVRSTVSESGGTTITLQSNVRNVAGAVSKTTVLLRVRLTEAELIDVVHAIESAAPRMIFEALEVHPLPQASAQAQLDATITLIGLSSDAP